MRINIPDVGTVPSNRYFIKSVRWLSDCNKVVSLLFGAGSISVFSTSDLLSSLVGCVFVFYESSNIASASIILARFVGSLYKT